MHSSDARGAAVLSAAALALYLRTLCPNITWHDSAEFVGAAVNLGVPHAPGYPLYVLLGHAFTRLLPLPPAAAVHTMNALLGALGVGLAFALLRRLGAGRAGALAGAALLGVSRTWWSEAIIAEVHAPAVTLLLGVLLILLSAIERRSEGWAIAAAMLAGLGLGAHYLIATAGLGLAVMVMAVPGRPAAWDRAALIGRAKLGLAAVGGVFLGALIFLFVPIRQTALAGLETVRWGRFLFWLSGGSFQAWFFDAPVVSRGVEIARVVAGELTAPGLALALLGVLHLRRTCPIAALALPLIAAGNIGYFFHYLQIVSPEFFLPAIAALALLAGMGVDGLARALGDRRPSRALVAVLALALPLWLLVRNYAAVDRSADTVALEYAEHLIEEIPHGAVIISYMSDEEWRYHTVFRDYVQGVLGERRDVLLWPMLDYQPLVEATRAERPIYLYYPVPGVEERFVLRKEGHLYRVVTPLL
jgi:hypothetical protein